MLHNCLKERKNNNAKNERFRTEAFESFELKNKKKKGKKHSCLNNMQPDNFFEGGQLESKIYGALNFFFSPSDQKT